MPIDYSKYPPNWKTDIVPAVIERAKGKCEWCELANKQEVYSVKFAIRDQSGKYKMQSIWFRNKMDAEREAGNRPIKNVIVVLTVAHLDHDETNHHVELERLRALCQICHLRYDAKEKYRRINSKKNQNELQIPIP